MNDETKLVRAKDRTIVMNPLDNGLSDELDMFLHSESPRAQQIRLYQKLKEEIDNNSNGRVRYVDSELYLRNQSPAGSEEKRSSEVQTATLSFANQATSDKITSSKSVVRNKVATNFQTGSTSSPISNSVRRNSLNERHIVDNGRSRLTVEARGDDLRKETAGKLATELQGSGIGSQCQVCLVREVKEDLISVTKLIQERNEQLTKLKARQLRSFFERQMLD